MGDFPSMAGGWSPQIRNGTVVSEGSSSVPPEPMNLPNAKSVHLRLFEQKYALKGVAEVFSDLQSLAVIAAAHDFSSETSRRDLDEERVSALLAAQQEFTSKEIVVSRLSLNSPFDIVLTLGPYATMLVYMLRQLVYFRRTWAQAVRRKLLSIRPRPRLPSRNPRPNVIRLRRKCT